MDVVGSGSVMVASTRQPVRRRAKERKDKLGIRDVKTLRCAWVVHGEQRSLLLVVRWWLWLHVFGSSKRLMGGWKSVGIAHL